MIKLDCGWTLLMAVADATLLSRSSSTLASLSCDADKFRKTLIFSDMLPCCLSTIEGDYKCDEATLDILGNSLWLGAFDKFLVCYMFTFLSNYYSLYCFKGEFLLFLSSLRSRICYYRASIALSLSFSFWTSSSLYEIYSANYYLSRYSVPAEPMSMFSWLPLSSLSFGS